MLPRPSHSASLGLSEVRCWDSDDFRIKTWQLRELGSTLFRVTKSEKPDWEWGGNRGLAGSPRYIIGALPLASLSRRWNYDGLSGGKHHTAEWLLASSHPPGFCQPFSLAESSWKPVDPGTQEMQHVEGTGPRAKRCRTSTLCLEFLHL